MVIKMKTVEELMNALTLEEKIALVSGHNFMYTNAIPRLGIPSIRMSDGPHGLRKQDQEDYADINKSKIATCFPSASAIASSFNRETAAKLGVALSPRIQWQF